MAGEVKDILKNRVKGKHYDRLVAVDHPKMHHFIADAIELTNPASVYVCTDSPEDVAHIRALAVKNGEEIPSTSRATPAISTALTTRDAIPSAQDTFCPPAHRSANHSNPSKNRQAPKKSATSLKTLWQAGK